MQYLAYLCLVNAVFSTVDSYIEGFYSSTNTIITQTTELSQEVSSHNFSYPPQRDFSTLNNFINGCPKWKYPLFIFLLGYYSYIFASMFTFTAEFQFIVAFYTTFFISSVNVCGILFIPPINCAESWLSHQDRTKLLLLPISGPYISSSPGLKMQFTATPLSLTRFLYQPDIDSHRDFKCAWSSRSVKDMNSYLNDSTL